MTKPVRMWRYAISADKIGSDWAVFLIDSTGMFAVVSDRGNYAHWWSDFGDGDFREFLAQLDWDYIRRKLDSSEEYNGAATLKAVEAEIKRAFKVNKKHGQSERELLAHQEQIEWELLSDHNELAAREDWAAWAQETRLDASAVARWQPPNDIMVFVKVIYPRFVKMLRSELAQEAQSAARSDS